MKKHFVKVLTVAAFFAGFSATNAFAAPPTNNPPTQTPANKDVDVWEDSWYEDGVTINDPRNPAMNPYFNLVSEVNKVDIDFMATVISRYSFYDQTRKQNFDFLNQLALFGVHMYKGNIGADLLLRFAGNPLRAGGGAGLVGDARPTNGAGNEAVGPVDTVGSVGIRKANINYKFWHNKNSAMRFTVGRFAPYGEDYYDEDNVVRAWGTDATVNLWGPNGSGDLHGTYVDGVSLAYIGKWAHSSVKLQGGITSDLPVFLYLFDGSTGGATFNIHKNPYQAFGNDSSFGGLSTNAQRAWLGDAAYTYESNWGGIQAAVDFGGKNNAETVSTVLNNVIAGSPVQARNMYYVAGSLGYELRNKLNVGAWYHWVRTSQTETGVVVTPIQDGQVNSYSLPGNDNKSTFSQLGVGINFTSKLWNKSNIGGRGGVMTFAAGYEAFMQNNGFDSSYTTLGIDQSVNLFSAAVGWARGPLAAEVDWAMFTAKNNVFYTRTEGEYAKVANVVYFVGSFNI